MEVSDDTRRETGTLIDWSLEVFYQSTAGAAPAAGGVIVADSVVLRKATTWGTASLQAFDVSPNPLRQGDFWMRSAALDVAAPGTMMRPLATLVPLGTDQNLTQLATDILSSSPKRRRRPGSNSSPYHVTPTA